MKDGLIVLEKGKEVIVSMSQVEGTLRNSQSHMKI